MYVLITSTLFELLTHACKHVRAWGPCVYGMSEQLTWKNLVFCRLLFDILTPPALFVAYNTRKTSPKHARDAKSLGERGKLNMSVWLSCDPNGLGKTPKLTEVKLD